MLSLFCKKHKIMWYKKIFLYIHVYLFPTLCVSLSVSLSVRLSFSVYIYMCVCVCVYVCAYICVLISSFIFYCLFFFSVSVPTLTSSFICFYSCLSMFVGVCERQKSNAIAEALSRAFSLSNWTQTKVFRFPRTIQFRAHITHSQLFIYSVLMQ